MEDSETGFRLEVRAILVSVHSLVKGQSEDVGFGHTNIQTMAENFGVRNGTIPQLH